MAYLIMALAQGTGAFTGIDLAGASYDNKSFDASSQADPSGIYFSADGTKMYTVGGSPPARIYQYNLSVAWDVSTALYSTNNEQAGNMFFANGVVFNSDGTKAVICSDSINPNIQNFSLSTAWDISTLSAGTLRTLTECAGPVGVAFSSDGTVMQVLDNDNKIHQYGLSIAWDVASATFETFEADIGGSTGTDVAFNNDGTQIFTVDSSDNTVRSNVLLTTWKQDTGFGSASSFVMTGQGTNPQAVQFSSDNMKMYVASSGTIYQYSV